MFVYLTLVFARVLGAHWATPRAAAATVAVLATFTKWLFVLGQFSTGAARLYAFQQWFSCELFISVSHPVNSGYAKINGVSLGWLGCTTQAASHLCGLSLYHLNEANL